MEFTVTPYASVGPLKWDMDAQAVTQRIGSPSRTSRNRAGHRFESRSDPMPSCIFDQDTGLLLEVAFSKNDGVVFFDGMDLVEPASRKVVQFLAQHDPGALEDAGTQVFPLLGISLHGYEPEELKMRVVTVFARGRWDGLLQSMQALKPAWQTTLPIG